MGLLRIQGKVVKESGKKVKTRHVSINSIKTRGEELKAARRYRELMLIQDGAAEEMLEKELCCRVRRINRWFWSG